VRGGEETRRRKRRKEQEDRLIYNYTYVTYVIICT
jgi:hypothetical protein